MHYYISKIFIIQMQLSSRKQKKKTSAIAFLNIPAERCGENFIICSIFQGIFKSHETEKQGGEQGYRRLLHFNADVSGMKPIILI
jgi:hypothetical protein